MTDASVAAIDITVLPDALFASVAGYLARPSQVAFVVVVEGLPGPKHSVLASGSEWSTLDFGEVEASLACKISDQDLCRMLTTIDAVNNLKTLKLTGCTSVRGGGLAPLTGSTSLEVIDLVAGRRHALSSDVVVPIICSIVEQWVGKELEKHGKRRRLKLTNDYGSRIELHTNDSGRSAYERYRARFSVEARAINYYRDDDSDDSG
ncbi:hypothetical protein ACHAXT_009838 [Thalassiosira profunda]